MNASCLIFLLGFASIIALTAGECRDGCKVPTLIYEDLNCKPKQDATNECCPKEYDCSHVHNFPAGKCHLKGKLYEPGQRPENEIYADRCDHAFCECGEGGRFSCAIPSDSCGEWWVPGWVKPGCYLKYEQNQCCSTGQVCPPFDPKSVTCEVNGKTYKEGEQFDHPAEKCTKCICDKGFSGKFEAPSCQRLNCTAELLYSKEIEDSCAPYYQNLEDCCPGNFICPSDNGKYLPASNPANNDAKCKFGEKTMGIGEKYEEPERIRGTISCECVVPPFLTCTTVY